MHVLVIPRGLYDVPTLPNQGVFESHQVAALRAAGHRLGVLSGGVITTRFVGRRFPYHRKELLDDVPVYRAYRRAYLPARWEDPRDAAAKTYGRIRPMLEDYIEKFGRPDVVHAHNLTSGGLLAKHVHDETGIPYVVTEHTSTYAAEADAAQRDAKVLALGASGARAIIAVGSHLAASLQRAIGPHIPVLVIPNVVDSQLLACPLGKPQGAFTVGGLGYLLPRKNYALLIEAFARADLPAGARLVIGGDGPELGRLSRLARSLECQDRVNLPGHLNREQIVELLREVDLFAHPSDSESFGVVLIEAMAVGVPVLATACNGPLDIVTPEVGRLTPVGDVTAFADALSKMYQNRSQFDPGEIREYCRLHYGAEAFATRMLNVYQNAVLGP